MANDAHDPSADDGDPRPMSKIEAQQFLGREGGRVPAGPARSQPSASATEALAALVLADFVERKKREKNEPPPSRPVMGALLAGAIGSVCGGGGAIAIMKFATVEKEQGELQNLNSRLDTMHRITNDISCLSGRSDSAAVAQRRELVRAWEILTGRRMDDCSPPQPQPRALDATSGFSEVPPASAGGKPCGAGGGACGSSNDERERREKEKEKEKDR